MCRDVSLHPDDPLADCRKEDFDGHTDFADMAPGQRLERLATVVEFAVDVRRQRTKP